MTSQLNSEDDDMPVVDGADGSGDSSVQSSTWFGKLIDFVQSPIRDATRLQRHHLQNHDGFDSRTTIVMVVAAICLTLRSYCFGQAGLVRWVSVIEPWWPSASVAISPEHIEFSRLAYWVVGQDLLYVVLPALVIKFVFRERLSDYGLKLKGMFQFGTVYLAMLGIMIPLIVWLSRTESFQHQYPFYNLADGEPLWPKMIIWELLYATQFISLEFFFRGFMVHGTKHRFGPYCVLVMMVPYCMIHFAKPMPETFGAILAGIALGLMSLKTRSIWLGAALHIAVAWSMDAAALMART